MGALPLQILAIALPFARDIWVAYMKANSLESVSLKDLETLSPADLLKQMGIDVDALSVETKP